MERITRRYGGTTVLEPAMQNKAYQANILLPSNKISHIKPCAHGIVHKAKSHQAMRFMM
jgi:hypothetical protein